MTARAKKIPAEKTSHSESAFAFPMLSPQPNWSVHTAIISSTRTALATRLTYCCTFERTYVRVVSPQIVATGMCLGPDGFGACDAQSLWILAYTHPTKKTKAFVSMLAPEPEKMCLGSSSSGWFSSLRRVGVSK